MIWFHDPPARGSWNMALDEALLQRAAAGAPPVLRFFEWQEPTLSLGYFQPYADRAGHSPSAGCAVVRRATGGGAILHDRELTYSCVLPPGHRLGRRPPDLYNAIHAAIVAVLAELGLTAKLVERPNRSAQSAGCGALNQAAEPFLCFARRTPGDVLLDDWKIAGSAQRRHHGAVLQHGSILFGRSPFAPELPGLQDLTTVPLDGNDFASRLRTVLAQRLRMEFTLESASADLTAEAASVEASKFATKHWLLLR